MKEEITKIQADALAAIAAASGEQELDEARVAFLGKKGRLTAASAGMKDLSREEKPVAGQLLNAARGAITESSRRLHGVIMASSGYIITASSGSPRGVL